MKNLIIVALLTVFAWSCNLNPDSNSKQARRDLQEQISFADNHRITHYFPEDIADTILVNAVTFVGRKPPVASSFTRFEPQFRNYYIGHATSFSFYLYHITEDSTHLFFMIRPARSLEGITRGVIGHFRMNTDYSLYDFEEVANTRIKPREELQEIGGTLFREWHENGNIDLYLSDTAMIEWPDDRLKYDRIRNEWRYLENS